MAAASSPQISRTAAVACVVILSCCTTLQTLLVSASERKAEDPGTDNHMNSTAGNHTAAGGARTLQYSSFIVNMLVEVVKLVICIVGFAITKWRASMHPGADDRQAESDQPASSPAYGCRQFMLYAVPSCLYMLDNNIVYLILLFIDPPTLSLLWQLKIPITAILLACLLKRRVTRLQWTALSLLFVGVITTQSRDAESMSLSAGASPFIIGCLLSVLGASLSSSAGVYTEWILKRHVSASFFAQNAQLYTWGILFNLVGFFIYDYHRLTHGWFQGCSWFCGAIVAIQSASGLSVATVFKYVDNIAALYAHVFSMLTVIILSWLFLEYRVSLVLWCGFFTCCASLYLYHYKETPEPSLPSPSRTRHNNRSYQAVDTQDISESNQVGVEMVPAAPSGSG